MNVKELTPALINPTVTVRLGAGNTVIDIMKKGRKELEGGDHHDHLARA